MFLRFALPRMHPDTGVEEGVFHAAYELRNGGTIPAEDLRDLTALLAWFESNLATPTRFNRTKSKGYYRRTTKGVSWLKPTAETHIAKLRELSGILERHGHHVVVIKARRPGYIVHEDEFQVIAEPFRDTRS